MNIDNGSQKYDLDGFWKATLAVGGFAAIGAFVFWSLYKDWLSLPIFSKMTPEQTFQIMKIFLWLVFAVFFISAVTYVFVKKDGHRSKSKILLESNKEFQSPVNNNQKNEQIVNFILQLSPFVFDLIIFGEQRESRKVNPWLDNIRSRYKEISIKLRELSIQDVSIEKNWKEKIDELAQFIDKYVNSKNHKRIGVDLKGEMKDVVEKAKLLKGSKIDPFFVSQRASVTLKKDFLMQLRMLKSLNDRAETMLNEGRIEELQSNASKIGHDLLILSMYNTEEFPRKIKEKLYDIAEKIHLMEIEETHTIGEQKSFRNRLDELCEQLNALAVDLPSV